VSLRWAFRVSYVKALDQTVFDSKHMTNLFVGKEVAIEIAHDLMDLDNDLTVGASGEPDRLDVRIDLGPLARPVAANSGAAVDVTTFHAICPKYVLGQSGKHILHVASVEPVVKVFKKCHLL
jgi:hypothetical protein